MASSVPSTSTPTTSAVATMDSSALYSYIKCHRRMGSLKYDLHTVCSQCRDVVCSLTTRCEECTDWSSEVMSDYLKHKKSLATKSKKKPVTSASSVVSSDTGCCIQPFVRFPPRLPTVSDDSKIRDSVLSVLHALSQYLTQFSFQLPHLYLTIPLTKRGLLGETAARSPILWEA